jgi:hypothetical protein
MKIDSQTFRLTDQGNIGKNSLIVGIIGLALSMPGIFINRSLFFHSYLIAFTFWFTLAIGGLFFVMLHHLVDATWSVVIRRLSENVMAILPIMAIFFIPILFGIPDLYHWSHSDIVAQEVILQKKAGYLNLSFFIIRAIIYFLAWTYMAWSLYKLSLKQDGGYVEDQVVKMRRISAPGMVVFALTLTFASFDWFMSLNDAWYSTIFGVYIYAGSTLVFLAFMTYLAIYLREKGILDNAITYEHYHDLGKLLFTFVVFWGYIAFSQYFLIWYGNIPEETIWYKLRWAGGWKPISLIILFGQFGLPFLGLIARGPKRNLLVLKIMALWLLFMHWVDIYWLIMPSYGDHKLHFSWMALTTMAGIGGIVMWFFWSKMSSAPLLPVNDPKLRASIEIAND